LTHHEAAFLRIVRGETRGIGAASARALLWLASRGYAVGASARNWAFDHGWKKAHRASVPVISVGNLTLGGTGKTPLVEWIARWYRRHHCKVAILSRGYGQTGGMNDEGLVLEENLPDVPHLQGRDRVQLARIAPEELESELLILDDGFQHRGLARDLDIVVLDATDPFGLGHLFPRGLLRESPRSLPRATVVVLTRANSVDEPTRSQIREAAERWAGRDLAWAEARHAPRDLVTVHGVTHPLADLPRRKIVAFCGIGNPGAFERTLEGLGAEIAGFRVFPDHYAYTATDVSQIAGWARQSGADLALTTQKDFVKLRVRTLGEIPLHALRIGIDFLTGQDVLEATLARLIPRADD
jgi:tetraacyldisaccharide 4'-kinase